MIIVYFVFQYWHVAFVYNYNCSLSLVKTLSHSLFLDPFFLKVYLEKTLFPCVRKQIQTNLTRNEAFLIHVCAKSKKVVLASA